MPTPSNMAKTRKRLALACDTCRSRRVKCDGQRPYCTPCRTRGLDCFYQQLPESPATKVETELANVNQRLDYLTMLLSKQSQPLVEPQQPSTSALGSHEDSPFRLLATDSIMRVLDLDDRYARGLVQLERANLLVGTTTPSRVFFISHQQITDALAAFSDRVHAYYPILPLDFSETYFSILSGPLAPSCQTFLALLVAAIGCVAQDPTTGSPYFEAALASLPVVLAECTLTSIQCLIFLSIYYCCLLKPCQAHDHCLIASFKIQNLFKSELSVQLDVAKSDIWNLDEYIPLPNCRRTWQFPTPQAPSSLVGVSPASVHSTDSTSTTADQAQSFFLAEIAMRRMLHRCNSAVTRSPDGRPSYAPSIALELERQLDEWYEYLPTNIRFARAPDRLCADRFGSLSNFLNVQYYCCKISIYWPAIYQAVQDDGASTQLLDHCQRFIDSYVQLLPRIAFAVDDCLIYKWTLSVSFFTTTMAALKVAGAPCLAGASRDQIRECLASAVAVDWKDIQGSPSLELLQRTLNSRLQVAKY
ncbi:transcriptional activator protein acu-15 [Aspergillus udagawae]|uniref:Transcriptional activator protein acu-15 n=1 Tax=Aspergillus udagawae TaxID=91492 RepID=A0ABQ1B2S0_9EURO|nr:transcriptional activator protein acu-15 [Aspergillus udagawae]GFF92674.1 transcriptional activator protein acu-15 [Aspergillus udagawae]GFG11526.1 transcriptional activator protein acu-15 [Aspergillus udagawae]